MQSGSRYFSCIQFSSFFACLSIKIVTIFRNKSKAIKLVIDKLTFTFSVGTARNYIDDLHQDQAQLLQADPSLPANHRYFKLKFNKTIENSLDVMKIFCLLFCGPVLLVECIVTMINHRSIVQSCEAFYDPFTNVIVYFLIVVTVVSVGFLTVFIIGLIMCYRVIKQNWQEIRNYRGNNNRSDSNQDSVIIQNEQLLNYIDNEDEDDDEEEIDLFQQSINRRASRSSQIIGQQQRFQQNYEQYEYAIDYPEDDSDSDDDDHYQQDNYDQDGYGDENDSNDEEQTYGQSSNGLAEYVNDSFNDDYRINDQQNNYDDNENYKPQNNQYDILFIVDYQQLYIYQVKILIIYEKYCQIYKKCYWYFILRPKQQLKQQLELVLFKNKLTHIF